MRDESAISLPVWQDIATHAAIPGDVVQIIRRDAGAMALTEATGRVIRFDDIRQAPRGAGRRCINWTLLIDLFAPDPEATQCNVAQWPTISLPTDDEAFRLRRDARHGSAARSLSAGASYLRDLLLDAAGEDPVSTIARLIPPDSKNGVPLGFAAAARILDRHDTPREWMIQALRDRRGTATGSIVPFPDPRVR